MALKVVHDGEAPGALRENCCICRTKTNYWYEPKDVALCEHCAKTTKRAALPTKEEWCAKEAAIFKQKNTHTLEASVALSELDMMNLWAKQLTGYKSQWERLFGFGYAVEAEVRKQDAALIRQMLEALEKVDQAMPFPVARQAITAARARLGEKT